MIRELSDGTILVGSNDFVEIHEGKPIRLGTGCTISKDLFSSGDLKEIVENYYRAIGKELCFKIKDMDKDIRIICEITIYNNLQDD